MNTPTPTRIPTELEVAEYREFLAKRSARVQEVIAEKAARGEISGCAPVGYVNKRQGYDYWVEVEPEQGPLVSEAFHLAATTNKPLREGKSRF